MHSAVSFEAHSVARKRGPIVSPKDRKHKEACH